MSDFLFRVISIQLILFCLMLALDWAWFCKRRNEVQKRELKVSERIIELQKEREELRRTRRHFELLAEDFARLECEEVHMPGDCPRCGAV